MEEQHKVTSAIKNHKHRMARSTSKTKRGVKPNPKSSKKPAPIIKNVQKYARPSTLPLHKIKVNCCMKKDSVAETDDKFCYKSRESKTKSYEAY